MSAQTKLVNKLKQFKVEFDPKRIYTQTVVGKRNDIFSRGKEEYLDKDDYMYQKIYNAIKNLRSSAWKVTIDYRTVMHRDTENNMAYQNESEWYGVIYNGVEIIFERLKDNKVKSFKI